MNILKKRGVVEKRGRRKRNPCPMRLWGQHKDYKYGICCFSDKNADLRSRNRDWLAWNQDTVSE